MFVSEFPSLPDTVMESIPLSKGSVLSELAFAMSVSMSKPFSFKAVSTIVKSLRPFLFIKTCRISYVPAGAYLFNISLIDQLRESFFEA